MRNTDTLILRDAHRGTNTHIDTYTQRQTHRDTYRADVAIQRHTLTLF